MREGDAAVDSAVCAAGLEIRGAGAIVRGTHGAPPWKRNGATSTPLMRQQGSTIGSPPSAPHRHTDLSPEAGIKAVIVASPGFLKDEFLAYMCVTVVRG